MIEEFRSQAGEEQFEVDAFEDIEPYYQERRFLGMTPAQRFLIAVLLFLVTCLGGSFCLLITGKISPLLF